MGASRAAPGKSGLHARGEGERPQAQLLSVVVFPHFLRVNSSSFTEKRETESFAYCFCSQLLPRICRLPFLPVPQGLLGRCLLAGSERPWFIHQEISVPNLVT